MQRFLVFFLEEESLISMRGSNEAREPAPSDGAEVDPELFL